MLKNKYIVKSLTPWMIDELIAFSTFVKYDLILLREPDEFYKEGLQQLEKNGINIYTTPFLYNYLLKKFVVILIFFFSNILKFDFSYNTAVGIKSLGWFLKLDMNLFSKDTHMHAQFATQPALISLLIKRFYANKPLFSFTFHAHDIYFNNKWFKLLVDNCYKSFSISDYNIDYVQKKYIYSDKIVLARLGVFRDHIKTENKKKESQIFNLGVMSWFVKKKGIIYLLRAFKKLKEKGFENIKLSLAGDGPLKEKLLKFIKEKNLTSMITYIGKINGRAKEKFYASLDGFVLPSISLKNDQDGIPVVLMEAIAYSLPIISTDVSGIPEICIDKYNGFLIPERDYQKVYESILKLYNNKADRQKYSKNSRSLSDKYDIILNSKKKLIDLQWV